jgi:hypothetical protein
MKHLVYRERQHTDGKHAGQSEVYWPDPDERGLFELGDSKVPKKPDGKNQNQRKEHAIFVENEKNAVRLVREYGFSFRMKGELTGQRNLIKPESIKDVLDA